jgi:hypothetical protein
MRFIFFAHLIFLSFLSAKAQDYKVSVFPDPYIELDTFDSVILETGDHLGWNKRFELDFIFPYYDTSFNYINGNYESIYSFENEIDYSIILMAFGYEFDKLTDLNKVTSDLRYALKVKDGKKALCLQYTKNRLTSDPSVKQFDSYINFQVWFVENGNIELKFGDYLLDNSPVYVPNEGFYLQTVNVGPLLLGPTFGLNHPFSENIKFGVDGPYDSLKNINDSGYLTKLPPAEWTIKFEKQTTGTQEIPKTKEILFPNPTSHSISFYRPIHEYIITNMAGKVIMTHSQLNPYISELDVSSLTSGMYIIKSRINNFVNVNKFIKI